MKVENNPYSTSRGSLRFFFLFLSHPSWVSARLSRIAFVSDTCNVSLKAAHHIGDAQMMVDVQCGQSIDVSRIERQCDSLLLGRHPPLSLKSLSPNRTSCHRFFSRLSKHTRTCTRKCTRVVSVDVCITQQENAQESSA